MIDEPEFVTDPDQLEQVAFNYLRSVFPGWAPSEADAFTWIVRAHARMVAEERDQAATVYPDILQYLGEKVHRILRLPASAATVAATFAMRDDAGYTIPAGLEVFVETAGDDGVIFIVQAPVVVDPGSDRTADGAVTLVAGPDYIGTVANDLDSTNTATVLRAEQQYQAVTLVGASAGGADEEDIDAYLARLAEELTLTSPIPILPDDFAALARRHLLVGRALAINLYDPVTRTSDNERMVTVVVADASGEPVSRTVRDEVQATLEAMRELNWRCPVIDPSYTPIDVAFEATAWPGEDPGAVRDAALAALAAGLSPANHGRRPGGLADDETTWIDEPTVRYLEVVQMLQEVPGLRYVDRLEIAREGGVLGASNITLTGPGALPRPGAGIRGTVTGG